MEITLKQKEFLKDFSCERLSSNDENKQLIKSFANKRASQNVIKEFKTNAWDKDKEGHTAYYIIKYSKKEIVLFFAIKCGSLYTSFDAYIADIERRIQHSGLDDRVIHNLQKQKVSLQKSRAADEKKYQSQHSQHVFETFPGIELTLFYINETFTYRFKSIWAEQKIVHTIGTVLFWQHISPLFEKIKKQIGCQYLFLFAADSSADGKLINYYSSTLKFDDNDIFGTNKPVFDFLCQFMYQEINGLQKHRETFFLNFNPDENDI